MYDETLEVGFGHADVSDHQVPLPDLSSYLARFPYMDTVGMVNCDYRLCDEPPCNSHLDWLESSTPPNAQAAESSNIEEEFE